MTDPTITFANTEVTLLGDDGDYRVAFTDAPGFDYDGLEQAIREGFGFGVTVYLDIDHAEAGEAEDEVVIPLMRAG